MRVYVVKDRFGENIYYSGENSLDALRHAIKNQPNGDKELSVQIWKSGNIEEEITE